MLKKSALSHFFHSITNGRSVRVPKQRQSPNNNSRIFRGSFTTKNCEFSHFGSHWKWPAEPQVVVWCPIVMLDGAELHFPVKMTTSWILAPPLLSPYTMSIVAAVTHLANREAVLLAGWICKRPRSYRIVSLVVVPPRVSFLMLQNWRSNVGTPHNNPSLGFG